VKIFLGSVCRGDGRLAWGAKDKLVRTIARYAKHKLAGVGHRGKAAPPKSRQGGQNDYQMRTIINSKSIEDENDSQQTA
jgi:hypothetical protein